MSKEFFPRKVETNPTIYAYQDTNPQYLGLLKVGFTTIDAQTRVAQQYPIVKPGKLPYVIVLEESAMRTDGSAFSDHDVHRVLRKKGFKNNAGEWFECTARDVRAALIQVRTGEINEDDRTLDFGLRPEQAAAVEKTIDYFTSFKKENKDKTPHFLWNAKMRFGKTFATYQLAKKMGWKRSSFLHLNPQFKAPGRKI